MPEQIKKRRRKRLKLLEHELTTELPAEIKRAVALGDLSENAEYHMAKQRQVFVNARLGQLKKRMGELAMVNLANIPRDKVGFGATVVVFDSSKNEEITYKLVTSEESDVTKGLISTTSPIGRALARQAGRRRRHRRHPQRQARTRGPQAHHHPRLVAKIFRARCARLDRAGDGESDSCMLLADMNDGLQ